LKTGYKACAFSVDLIPSLLLPLDPSPLLALVLVSRHGGGTSVPSPHQQQSVGHGEKMPDVFDRRSPPTELMASPTDRFDVVSHVEGALPSPLLSPAPMMMERLAAMTIWISRPATRYSTSSAPVCQDPQSSCQHLRWRHLIVPAFSLSPRHSAVSCHRHGLHGGTLSRGNRSTVNGLTPL
jgi:hypothetical protein